MHRSSSRSYGDVGSLAIIAVLAIAWISSAVLTFRMITTMAGRP